MLADIEMENLRLLVESVKDYAIFMIDPHGYVLTWNKGAEQIKGYKTAEIIGKHFSIFYTQEQIARSEPEKNLQYAIENERFEVESLRVKKDGTVFWADVVITAVWDQNKHLVGYGKVTRDLTERRKAEDEISLLNAALGKELHQSRNLIADYQHALEESSIVAITDQKGIISYVNDNFCKISKFSRNELIGRDHRIINAGFHSSETIRNLWITIANGKIWRGELKNKAKDGTFYWVDTTIVPFLDEKGKPYQYLAIRNDITQRKLAEEELLNRKASLEITVKERTIELIEAVAREKAISEMKSRFVSMASHEFRTPLSTILSSISLIERYDTDSLAEKRNKHIARIKSSVRDLTGVLEDFLSLEQLESGKLEIHLTQVELKDFIEDIIDEMDAPLKRKTQQIKCAYTGAGQTVTDKKILKNILINLISNAIKYSPDNKTIYITAEVKDMTAVISVRDEGIGIPAADQQKMFRQFFRSQNVSTIPGTGLGLNIVKRYIELLEGDISFCSQENIGTTFTVKLPLKKGDV